jgi:hypothetical protein
MNRILEEVTDNRFHYESHDRLESNLADVVIA